jgi:hypothetical protein
MRSVFLEFRYEGNGDDYEWYGDDDDDNDGNEKAPGSSS